jgi:hypothetical protein
MSETGPDVWHRFKCQLHHLGRLLRCDEVMQLISNSIISAGAALLLVIGIYLVATDKPAQSSAALGFAFLYVVLLLLAKFKRFKGFGFEAEMWEQKQEEAAAIIENLKEASTRISNVKDKIRENIRSRPDHPGHITAETVQEILLELADAVDLAVRR